LSAWREGWVCGFIERKVLVVFVKQEVVFFDKVVWERNHLVVGLRIEV
jgi:hypothetical protein